MAWTNDVVLEFLELYKSEPQLWDPKHPLHRHRNEVTEAWQRIQSSLSVRFSVCDLKRKKESLMTSFRMHFSKKRKSQYYCISWFAYSLMESFLGGKYECDSTNHADHDHEYYNTSSEFNKQAGTSEQNIGQNYNLPEKKHSKSLTMKVDTEYNYVKRQMNDAVKCLKNVTGEKRETDEYELYGQLLAKKLKKLDEHQRDIAMHDIDNIMFRAKMQTAPIARGYSTSPSPVPRKTKSPIFIITPHQNQTQFEDENIAYEEHSQVELPMD